jgi:predicted permease
MADPGARTRTESSASYVLFQALRTGAEPAARIVAKGRAGRRKFGLQPESRERVTGEAVSDEFFAALGVTPAAGRLFVAGDDRTGGGARIAVLSHRFWTTRFHADAAVVGQTIYYEEAPFQVVGVAAERFAGVDAERPVDVWVPVTADPAIQRASLQKPSSYWLTLLARLGPAMTPAALESLLDQRFRAHMDAHVLPGIPERMRKIVGNRRLHVRSAAAGLATSGRQYESPLQILMILALSVFLICCANVANLVRARNGRREPEFSLRRALGASRGRLARQLATEGLLLTGAGAIGGLLLAPIAARWLLRIIPNGDLAFEPSPDLPIVAAAIGLAAATALAVFVWPGWRLATASRDLSATRVSRQLRGGRVIVAAQFATVMVLLVVTGLALTALRRLNTVPLGFDATSVWSVDLSFPKDYADSGIAGTMERLRLTLQDATGVEAATYAFPAVYDTGGTSLGIVPDGYVPAPGEDTQVGVLAIGPGFFQALHIPVTLGRVFESADVGSDSTGVIVNEAFARRYFPEGPVLGRSIRMPARPLPRLHAIIGIVADVRHYGVRSQPWPMVYSLGAQRGSSLLVRTRDSGSSLASLQANLTADAHAQVETVRPLSDAVAVLVGRERVLARLSTVIAIVTLLLAALGLYGITAFAVTCRRTEFGIRLALGASPVQVRRLVLRDAAAVVGFALGTGFACSYLASRLFARFTTDVPPMDFATPFGATVCLTAVAVMAAWLPAWRAGRTDPIITLKAE